LKFNNLIQLNFKSRINWDKFTRFHNLLQYGLQRKPPDSYFRSKKSILNVAIAFKLGTTALGSISYGLD